MLPFLLWSKLRNNRFCILLFLCLVSLGCLLVACVGKEEPTNKGATAVSEAPTTMDPHLIVPGILTVGSYANYVPQEYVDPQSKQLTGFDIDLITLMSQRMHLRVQIVPTDFSSLATDLEEKDFDVVISAMPITPELQRQVSLIPYFRGGESLLVQKGNPFSVKHVGDLCGLHVGAIDKSVELAELDDQSQLCQRQGKSPVVITTASNSSQALQLLQSRSLATIYLDSALADYLVKLSPTRFQVASPVNEMAVEGIAVRMDDTVLTTLLQQTFHTIVADGSYHRLILQWGLINGDITVSTALDH